MNTAGGHSELFINMGSSLHKILEDKSKEKEAYEILQKDPNLKGIIPDYYGSYLTDGKSCIIIENLLDKFDSKNLSIIDIKMVTRNFSHDPVYAKLFKREGFRVAGLIKESENNLVEKFQGCRKEFYEENLVEINNLLMLEHVTFRGRIHSNLIMDIILELEKIKSAIKHYPVYNSSILICTDYKKVVCRLIDFGHYGDYKYGHNISPLECMNKIILGYKELSKSIY